MVEVIPTPTELDALMPGDEVSILYDLMQGGEWFVAWQIGKLETAFEEDGRFMLKAYQYDPDNFKLRLKVIVRETSLYPAPADVQQANVGIVLVVLVGMVASYLAGMITERYRIEYVQRKLSMLNQIDASDQPQAVKDKLKQQVLEGQPGGLASLGGPLTLVAVAVLALLLGVKR